MTDKKRMLLADIALILSAVCWGGGFIAGDVAVDCFAPFVIMTVRFIAASLVILLIFHRSVRRSGKAEIKAGAILGTILFFAQPLQVIALKYTTPSKQAFLVASYAAFVPFVSWLVLRKKPKGKAFVAGFLTLAGIGMISLNSALTIELGDALSLGFALLYSLMIVVTGICVTKCDPLAMSFFSFLTTGLLSLVVAVLFEEMPTVIPTKGIWALAYLAVVTTGVAYTLQNVAQRFTSDTHVAILISTESLFGFVFGVFLFGDPFTYKLLVGGLIVFAAVIVSEVDFKKKPKLVVGEEIEGGEKLES